MYKTKTKQVKKTTTTGYCGLILVVWLKFGEEEPSNWFGSGP